MDTRIQFIKSYERKLEQLMKQCKSFTDITAKALSKEIIGDVSVLNNISKKCAEIQRDLEIQKRTTNDNINIICVGNKSCGKSALINALIGKKIIKSSPVTTTRCFVRLSRSENNKVVSPDGKTTICSSDETVKKAIISYMHILRENDETTEAEIQVYLDIDSPILRDNVYIHDSPGGGNLVKVTDFVKKRCIDMDIMIIVMPYNITTDIERNFEDLAKSISGIPVFILINKWDETDDDTDVKDIEVTKAPIERFVKKSFTTSHHTQSDKILFYVSAKEILSYYPNAPVGKSKEHQRYNDFQDFKSRLSKFIINCEAQKLKRFNSIREVIIQNFDQLQNMYTTKKKEIRIPSVGCDKDTRYFKEKYDSIKTGIDKWTHKSCKHDVLPKMKKKCDDVLIECDALLERCTFVSQASTDNISIMCIGNVSVGKSMIINSIIEEDIMTSAGSHTTRCFVRISKGDTNKVVSPNDKITLCPTNTNIQNAVKRINGEVGTTEGSEIQIYLNNDSTILVNNVHLYDTPGLGREGNMLEFLIKKCKTIDIIILVVNNSVPTNIENIFKTIAEYTTEIPTFILVNKWEETDNNTDNEVAELKKQLNTTLKRICKSKYQIYYVSGKEAMQTNCLEPAEKKKRQRYEEFKKFKSNLSDSIEDGSTNSIIRRVQNCEIIKEKLKLRETQYDKDKIEFRTCIASFINPWTIFQSNIKDLIHTMVEEERNADKGIKDLIQGKSDYNTFETKLKELDKQHNYIDGRIKDMEISLEKLISEKSHIDLKKLQMGIARVELFQRQIDGRKASWYLRIFRKICEIFPGKLGYETMVAKCRDSVIKNNKLSIIKEIEDSHDQNKEVYTSMRTALISARKLSMDMIKISNELLVVLE